jgi:hypothetical protein
MKDKKRYPIWSNTNGNRVENNTINMNNSNFTMNSFSFKGDNIIRNNVIDMINSHLKQNSFGFSCRNLMDNNSIKLENSTIEQSCVIIVKDRGMKRPHIRVTKRVMRGK